MKKKLRFILNPFSGVTNKKDIPGKIKDLLDPALYTYELIFTQYAGHATELAAKAVKDNFDMVVAVGGDGSINEVAKALVNTDTILGVIPAGSGNGFASSIGLETNPQKAIGVLNNGKVMRIDTCTVNNDFFINVAGVGFDGQIIHDTKEESKRGFKVYAKSVLAYAIKYINEEFTVQLNEKTFTKKYFSISIVNGPILGFKVSIAPNADLQDGLMEMVEINDAPMHKYMASSWRFLNESIDKSPHITTTQCKEVVISNKANKMYYHVDGEAKICNGKLHFEIIPNSLNVWVPQ